MLESVFYGTSGDISFLSAAVCTAMSLILGLGIAGIHMYQNQSSRNFLLTLVILPFIVQMVIMMVNGSLGTGIAVMGAFSLVRFRSMPGSAREISSVFLAMAAGLADGIGFVWASAAMVVIAGAVTVVVLRLPDRSGQFLRRELKVTIPEDLDYTGIFDEFYFPEIYFTTNLLDKLNPPYRRKYLYKFNFDFYRWFFRCVYIYFIR